MKRGATDCEPAEDGLAVARCTFRNNTAAVTGEPRSVQCSSQLFLSTPEVVCSRGWSEYAAAGQFAVKTGRCNCLSSKANMVFNLLLTCMHDMSACLQVAEEAALWQMTPSLPCSTQQ
jgi:hypothetical protein